MYWHNVSFLKPLGLYLLERNLRPAEFLRRSGLPATVLLEDGETWIRRDASLRLTEELHRFSGEPWAGLQAMRGLRIEDCGSWGRWVSGCGHLDDAISVARANIGRLLTGTTMVVEEAGAQVRFGLRLDGAPQIDPLPHQLTGLLLLRKLVALTVDPVPVTAHLTGPRPAQSRPVERLLGSDLTFGASWNHLSLPRRALSLALSPASAPQAGRHSRAERVRDTATAVLDGIRRIIPTRRPTIVAIASDLGLSVRTLQRNLQRWGVSFEDMVDEFRRHRALAELTRGDLPITEIGYRLGYSDCAHFSRAVRRWAGCCPRDLREGTVRPATADWLSQGAPPTTMPRPLPPGPKAERAAAVSPSI